MPVFLATFALISTGFLIGAPVGGIALVTSRAVFVDNQHVKKKEKKKK